MCAARKLYPADYSHDLFRNHQPQRIQTQRRLLYVLEQASTLLFEKRQFVLANAGVHGAQRRESCHFAAEFVGYGFGTDF